MKELAEWLDEHGMYDNSPWSTWFDKNYCSKCESIECKVIDDDISKKLGFKPRYGNIQCAYCELEKKCKFFPDLEETPSCSDIIEMWLEQSMEE